MKPSVITAANAVMKASRRSSWQCQRVEDRRRIHCIVRRQKKRECSFSARVDRSVAEKTVTRCVSAEIPQRVSDIDAWRRVLHCREPPSQVSRSDQEKITSQEAKPDEIKSTKSARNMSRSMQGNLDEGESFVSSIQLERSEAGRSRVTCALNSSRQGSFLFRRETIVADQMCHAVELRRN